MLSDSEERIDAHRCCCEAAVDRTIEAVEDWEAGDFEEMERSEKAKRVASSRGGISRDRKSVV